VVFKRVAKELIVVVVVVVLKTSKWSLRRDNI
jgi:hypothetical protein